MDFTGVSRACDRYNYDKEMSKVCHRCVKEMSTGYGMYCMACTVWYVLYGMYCMVCTVWYVLYGMYCMVCTVWYVLYGITVWYVMYVWHVMYGM